MLWSRSASLIRITRTSSVEASSRRRKFSASVASWLENELSKVEILVRAATSRVTSGPNSSSSSAAVVSVSSRMSWSMPTAIAISSSSISARIQATVSGWTR